MKANLSFQQIDSLFIMGNHSESRRKQDADAFDSATKLLVELFVPEFRRQSYNERGEISEYIVYKGTTATVRV